jgi:hypothetical protein
VVSSIYVPRLKFCTHLHFPCASHAPPPHPPWTDHSNNVWVIVQIMNLLIMKRYPDSYWSTSSIFWYKYHSQHPALKQHNTCSFLKSERPILMTIREISIIIIEVWKFLMMAWHIALIFCSKCWTTLIGGKGNKLSFCLLSSEDISKTNFRNVVVLITPIPEARKQWGAPPGGAASCLHKRRIYFEQNMGARQNTIFGSHTAWLKYEACFILLLKFR